MERLYVTEKQLEAVTIRVNQLSEQISGLIDICRLISKHFDILEKMIPSISHEEIIRRNDTELAQAIPHWLCIGCKKPVPLGIKLCQSCAAQHK